MFETEYDYFAIVADSLSGDRKIDTDTTVSAAVLADRLERLKKDSELFQGVSISPYVKKILSHEMAAV